MGWKDLESRGGTEGVDMLREMIVVVVGKIQVGSPGTLGRAIELPAVAVAVAVAVVAAGLQSESGQRKSSTLAVVWLVRVFGSCVKSRHVVQQRHDGNRRRLESNLCDWTGRMAKWTSWTWMARNGLLRGLPLLIGAGVNTRWGLNGLAQR